MSAQTIPAVAEAFGAEHPIPAVAAAYRGHLSRWDRASSPRRVSRAFLRQLRSLGYTRVRLALDDRSVTFDVEDLLR
jgi:hypothetical protein